jgi:hypothetical protein
MIRLLVALLLTGLVLTSWRCTFGTMDQVPVVLPLEQLMRDPGRYDGKVVTVRGTVLDRMSLLGAGAYRIGAPAGESVVVVGLNSAPQPGEPVTVTGMFRLAAAIGAYQAPVILSR